MMTITNLTAFYKPGENILENISLNIEKNQVVGIIGANGNGKTTFINCISGVHEKYQVDDIKFHGMRIALDDPIFKFMRYVVYTESDAFGYWKFDSYCNFVAKSYNCTIDEQYLEELLTGFNFKEYRDAEINNLSSGNKKKCFLIAGLLLRLPLLILDEPFDGLDYLSSEYLIEQINQYREHGSILMTSHIAETFTRTCNNIAILHDHHFTQVDMNNDTDIKQLMSEYVD